jgi:uncharacterized RDD family membrane protein YckC
MSEITKSPVYVGFWKRVAATIIDTIAILAILLPLLYALYGSAAFSADSQQTSGPMGLLLQVVLPAVAVIMFWKYRGATPGKMLISAKVVDANTLGPISTGQAVGRYLAYFVSTFVFMLGFLWVAFDRRKQGWHDKLAGTVVIEAEDD